MGELAYAIDPADDGWRWRVFDVEGELVAGGVEPSQAAAESAAVALFHDGVCAASAI
ncbi:MAG: hypothetical protein JSR35_10870 [Proteobacteria bacterium]|nr:hypothetical protein [Pseudomonadota bacterium]